MTGPAFERAGRRRAPHYPRAEQVGRRGGPDPGPRLPGAVRISALTGEGIPELLAAVEEALPEKTLLVELLLPLCQNGLGRQAAGGGGPCSRRRYVPEGLRLSAQVDERLYAQVKDYQIS